MTNRHDETPCWMGKGRRVSPDKQDARTRTSQRDRREHHGLVTDLSRANWADPATHHHHRRVVPPRGLGRSRAHRRPCRQGVVGHPPIRFLSRKGSVHWAPVHWARRCARGGIRTPTPFRALAPEASASTVPPLARGAADLAELMPGLSVEPPEKISTPRSVVRISFRAADQSPTRNRTSGSARSSRSDQLCPLRSMVHN